MVEKKKKNDKDANGDNKNKNISLFDGGIQKSYFIAAVGNSDANASNMRIILPAFIRNEQQYSQAVRRKVHSSPIESSRRFSQDSQIVVHQGNVSL